MENGGTTSTFFKYLLLGIRILKLLSNCIKKRRKKRKNKKRRNKKKTNQKINPLSHGQPM